MSTKKSVFILGCLDFLFLGTYFVYIVSPVYLGYYPIGIVQLILLGLCLSYLVVHTKRHLVCNLKKQKPLAVFVFIGYVVSILFMLYSIGVWYAFMP